MQDEPCANDGRDEWSDDDDDNVNTVEEEVISVDRNITANSHTRYSFV